MKSKKLSETIIKNFKSNGFVLSEPDTLLDSDYIIEVRRKFRSSMLLLIEDGKNVLDRFDSILHKFLQKTLQRFIFWTSI